MLCRYALHHYRPAAGLATWHFVLLPLARASPRTSEPSFRTSRNWKTKATHTTDDDIAILVRHPPSPPPLDAPRSAGRAVCLLNDEPIRIMCHCSCALG